MTNSRTRAIRHKPRHTQAEAYDLLPEPIRDALKIGPQQWDTVAVLNRWRKLAKVCGPQTAISRTIALIEEWHAIEIATGAPWRQRRPGQPWKEVPPSPHVQANATMLR